MPLSSKSPRTAFQKPFHNEDQDSDLDELISTKNHEEELKNGKAPRNLYSQTRAKYYNYDVNYSTRDSSILFKICTLMGYKYMTYPKTGMLTTAFIVGAFLYTITFYTFNRPEEVGVTHYDMSDVKSALDLKAGRIDHWCIHGGDHLCKCEDPLIPSPKLSKKWIKAFKETQSLIPSGEDINKDSEIDIAFLGQGVVEIMNGNIMGKEIIRSSYGQHTKSFFQKRFGDGATMNGVALGIAGDSSPNILYRLKYGYLNKPEFDPYVWWIVVGMEDLARFECSEDVVVMGIIRLVEEIRMQRPNAKIVINSLFPMTKMRHGINDGDEFKDAERDTSRRRLDIFGMPAKEWKASSPEKQQEVKKKWWKKHAYEKELKYDKMNPELKDAENHMVRNRNVFLRKKNVNLWPSVANINSQLYRFAQKNENVKFFDATTLFSDYIVEEGRIGKRFTLFSNKISPRGHPTELGFKDWLDAVSVSSLSLLKEQREKYASERYGGDDFFVQDNSTMYDDYFNEFDDTNDDDGIFLFGDDDEEYYVDDDDEFIFGDNDPHYYEGDASEKDDSIDHSSGEGDDTQ